GVLDLLGELGEVVVLRPLVIGERDGDAHVDRLDDVDQLELLAPAALTAPTEQAGDLLLDACHPGTEHGPARRLAFGNAFRPGDGGHDAWAASAFHVLVQAATRTLDPVEQRRHGPVAERTGQFADFALEPAHRPVAVLRFFSRHVGYLLRTTG